MASICIDEDELEDKVYQFVRDKMVQAASLNHSAPSEGHRGWRACSPSPR